MSKKTVHPLELHKANMLLNSTIQMCYRQEKQIKELEEQMGNYPFSHWLKDVYGWIKRYTNTEGFAGVFQKITRQEKILQEFFETLYYSERPFEEIKEKSIGWLEQLGAKKETLHETLEMKGSEKANLGKKVIEGKNSSLKPSRDDYIEFNNPYPESESELLEDWIARIRDGREPSNICERCINEYIKDDRCYEGHEQYNLSNKIIVCSSFKPKKPIVNIHIHSEGKGDVEWIIETKDSVIIKYFFNKKGTKYPKLRHPKIKDGEKSLDEDKCKGCFANQYDEEFGDMCIAPACIKEYDYDLNTRSYHPKAKEKPSCLICGKTFNDYYCDDCHHNSFHKAHISLLQGYMKHDDPLKEIKRILCGEPDSIPSEQEGIIPTIQLRNVPRGVHIKPKELSEDDKKPPFIIPTVFGTPEELKKSHEELKKIAETIPEPDIEKLSKELTLSKEKSIVKLIEEDRYEYEHGNSDKQGNYGNKRDGDFLINVLNKENTKEKLEQIDELLNGKDNDGEISVTSGRERTTIEGGKDDSTPSDIDYEQCEKCGWNLPINCSQQERRPKKGDICPTFKPKGSTDDNLCSNCGKLNDMCGVYLRSINLCDVCIGVVMEIVTDRVLVKQEDLEGLKHKPLYTTYQIRTTTIQQPEIFWIKWIYIKEFLNKYLAKEGDDKE